MNKIDAQCVKVASLCVIIVHTELDKGPNKAIVPKFVVSGHCPHMFFFNKTSKVTAYVPCRCSCAAEKYVTNAEGKARIQGKYL